MTEQEQIKMAKDELKIFIEIMKLRLKQRDIHNQILNAFDKLDTIFNCAEDNEESNSNDNV